MGAAGIDRVRFVGYWNVNNDKPGSVGEKIVLDFKNKYKDDYYTMATYTVIKALAEAFNKSKSTEPVKVAFALEGLKFPSLNGEVEIRNTDHQIQQVLHIASWQKVDGKKVRHDSENTGIGWRTEKMMDAFVAAQPTSCNMKRPARPD
jgi:branched-chain amino acid transport system substrate-binding protein